MQVNLPVDTVERCRSLMNTKETWGAFIERILDENAEMRLLEHQREAEKFRKEKIQNE